MDTRHIATIDLGTSKTALTITEISGERVEIIYYKKIPSEGIRYSYVFNSKQAGDVVRELVEDAEKELRIKIHSAVVGMPKYSIRKESGNAKVKMDPEECITEEDVSELKDIAKASYPLDDTQNEKLYGAIAQSFSNGDEIGLTEEDIVGVSSDYFSGNFNLFIGKKKYLDNIDVAFKRIGLKIQKKFFMPEPEGKAILTKGEMDNGVALVDIGGGSTSVSVYYRGILRHYASIPFGGKSVTGDIKTECMIPEDIAEKIKTGFGGCMPDKLQNLSEKVLHICSESEIPSIQIPVKYLSEIITARMKEIIEAVLYEIQASGFADHLRSGVVLTGGGAKLLNCANWFKELSGYDTRVGKLRNLFSASGYEDFYDPDATVSAGLILAAKNAHVQDCLEDCTGESSSASADSTDTHGVHDQPEENAFENHETNTEAPEDSGNEASDDVTGTVFDQAPAEARQAGQKKKQQAQSGNAAPEKKKREPIWTKVGNLFNDMFDDFGKESV